MKKFVFFFVLVIAAVFITAFFLPRIFKIESSITIKKPVSQVFNYVRMLENGKEWQVISHDKNFQEEVSGQDGEVGAILTWRGVNNYGEQEITNIILNERIDFELRFNQPVKAKNKGYYIFKEVSDTETVVTWGLEAETKFPFNLICFLMNDKIMHDFSDSLTELKTSMENGQKN